MSQPPQSRPACTSLPTYDQEHLNAVIETPMGSHAKYAFDEKSGLFKLKAVLPAGAVFPYNFGFLPSTLADDGDPVDILVMMDAVAPTGSLIPSRVIGVIEAEQREEDGSTARNDRLIGVAAQCPTYGKLESLDQLSPQLIEQIEYFFVSYNKIRGKEFKPLGRFGHKRADKLIKAGMEKFYQRQNG